MNKLNEKQIEKLIDFVRNKPGLYDKKNPMFKKIKWKDEMWEDIADNLNCTANDCKAAWRSLRDQFCKCYRELKDRTAEYDTKKLYKNFVKLLFLKDSLGPRRRINDVEDLVSEDIEEETWDLKYVPVQTDNGNEVENSNRVSRNKRKHLDYETPTNATKMAVRTPKASDYSSDFSPSGSRKSLRIMTAPFAFESCSLAPTTTVPEPPPSPLATSEESCNVIWGPSESVSESITKTRKTDDLRELFTELLDKLVSKFDTVEPENVDVFFQSVAKTVKSFNLTADEISKLQCTVMSQVAANITEILNEREQN